MTEITVKRPFTLHMANGEKRFFTPGKQRVPGDLAEHWYVKQHCEPKSADSTEEVPAVPYAGLSGTLLPREDPLATPKTEEVEEPAVEHAGETGMVFEDRDDS